MLVKGCSSLSPKSAAKSQGQLRWEENLRERGRHFGADMSRTERADGVYGDLL